MKVSVIGGGAIGLLVSYYLEKSGKQPVLYTKTEEQANQLNLLGITLIDQKGDKETVSVQASAIQNYSGNEKYCVIAVKQTAIAELTFLKDKSYQDIFLLFLQNGISHIKFLETLQQKHLSVGVVEHGAMKEGYTTVHHLGQGRIKISSFTEEDQSDWEGIFHEEQFPFTLENNWKDMLFEKLIMNASINPVTAILKIPNGQLLKNEYAYSFMKELFNETVSVLNMADKRDELWKDLLDLCRNTSLNRSSMLKSVEGGQETEIEAITGEIIQLAEKKHMSVPTSKFVYKVIKALDRRG